jgi:hypothetical protein
MKNQNLLLTGILTIAISCPAFATGIGASDTTADCDNSTLGTYEGETNLQAQWTANTIHLNWYNDSAANNGTTITPTNNAAATCSYDGAITLPTNTMTKTGYEFAGWRVRTSSGSGSVSNILASLDASINGTVTFGHGWDNDADNYSRCISDDCSWDTTPYSGATDIALNEWKTEFSYGTIYGEASCNSTKPSNLDEIMAGIENETITEEQAISMIYGTNGSGIASGTAYSKNSTGQYCWCKATNYQPINGNKSSVGASRWVFNGDYGSSADCAWSCTRDCGGNVGYAAAFRSVVFNSAQ